MTTLSNTNFMEMFNQNVQFIECGNNNLIEFGDFNQEESTVMLTLNGEMFKQVHFCDKLEIDPESGLIVIAGRVCEAFVLTKLNVV